MPAFSSNAIAIFVCKNCKIRHLTLFQIRSEICGENTTLISKIKINPIAVDWSQHKHPVYGEKFSLPVMGKFGNWLDYSVLPYCQKHNQTKVYFGLANHQKYQIYLIWH